MNGPDVLPGNTYALVRPRISTRNVLITAGSRASARSGISLFTRSKPVAVAAQWAQYYAAAVLGPRAIPGERVAWEPPGGAARWQELIASLPAFDDLALYERPQASRTGLAAVLLHEGSPVGFLKLREDPGELDREHRAMAAFAEGPPETFRVPRILDRGETAGWHWMMIEALPSRPASSARGVEVPRLVAEVQCHLGPVLPRALDVPEHWTPMHGDLTPWNLRRCGPGLPWLIDWEDASWAPPGADLIYYAATSDVVLGSSTPADLGHSEAAEFWLERLASRSGDDHDAALTARLTADLRSRISPPVPR